ncbi:MAG: hypothetical protein JWM50_943 [Microbacteriaceae bacterium]|jgi:hypothetical protein|nr:hypothetical protein [Microbacteriaceae bacterium]
MILGMDGVLGEFDDARQATITTRVTDRHRRVTSLTWPARRPG